MEMKLDIWRAEDGKNINMRIMGPRVLVQMDPDKDTMADGLLVKPQIAHEHVLRTGCVIQVGEGAYTKKTGEPIPMSLKVGDGVLFIRFMADTKTAESIQHHIGKDKILLKEADVVLAYNRNEEPKFSQ